MAEGGFEPYLSLLPKFSNPNFLASTVFATTCPFRRKQKMPIAASASMFCSMAVCSRKAGCQIAISAFKNVSLVPKRKSAAHVYSKEKQAQE